MSIEHGVTTSASKAASKTAQTGGGHGAAKTQPATPGDFASLLMGLGAEDLPLQDALAETEDGAETLTTLTAVATVPQAAVDPAVLPVDASLPAVGLPQLTEPATAVVEVSVQEQDLSVMPSAVGDAAPALPPTAAGRADLRAPQAREQGVAEASSGMADAAAPADTTSPVTAPADELQPLLRQAVLAQRMAQHRNQAAEVVQDVKEQRGDDMASRLGWRISEQLAPAGSPWLLASDSGARPFERRSERSGPRIGGVGEAGGWSGVAQPDGARMDVPAVAPDGGLTTEMRVAEQVSYWVSRGAQTAELDVEGLGEGPVKVSIELQGQEARVEFRADQAQTRQVLQDSMPHLRELLEREGLVLSGMSVGTSGSERGAGQPGQGRQGGRQGQAGMPELPAAALAAAAHRAAPLSGRSVDLFV